MTEKKSKPFFKKSFLTWQRGLVIACVALGMTAAAFFLQQNRATGSYDSGLPVEKVIIHMQNGGSHTFEMEIAQKPIDLQVGLMYRHEMAPDHGMLFEMGAPQVTQFWMENTYIPLDMLFVDATGKIVTLHPNAKPLSRETISSETLVTAVIELIGGRAADLGIQTGDTVEYKYFQ